MHRGVKALMVSACLSAAACVTDTGKLQVRAIADPAANLRANSGDLAQAKALLALGSVGLALEAFRKTLREQPSNAEAMAGIAACYTAMGRYDLAQSNYESALALAPQDARLLTALAASLEAQGKSSEAARARADAALTEAPVSIQELTRAPAGASNPLAQVADSVVAASSTITVRLPPARPAEVPMAPPPRSVVAAATSITVQLPPATPVAAKPAPRRPLAPPVQLAQTAPHLERLSTGEVELVTTAKPIWETHLASLTRLSTSVRWIPIQSAAADRRGIQLLNGARTAGLAAHARSVLLDRGWRGIRIGDAPQVRNKSIIYYPANRTALGRRLAAQFGIRMLLARDGGGIVVVLGRDSAGLRAAQRRG